MMQNIKNNSPIRVDMSNILILQPMIASTALFMKHVTHNDDGEGRVASTNSKTVHVWPAFFRYTTEERLAILLHEYLHAAFAHPLRAKRLQIRLGKEYNHNIFNVAADGIINEGISKASNARIKLPEDGVRLKDIHEMVEKVCKAISLEVDLKRILDVSKITVEWLYDLLSKLHSACQQACEGCQDNAGSEKDNKKKGNEPSSSKENQENNTEKSEQQKVIDEFLEKFENPTDVDLDDLEGMTIEDVDGEIRKAAEKLKNSMAMAKGHGTMRSNIIETLIADIPEVKTPWEKSFRSITQKHLARHRIKKPTRPGRAVLSQKAMELTSIIWQPGRVRPRVPRVCIGLDTSGSVSQREYVRYLAEVQAMKRRTNAEIFVILCDTEIQSVSQIKDVKEISKIEFKGRGGTDFRPVFEIANTMDLDLLVYLTDLMGTFPDTKPEYPVLWTLPGMEIPNGYEPPFGKVLLLD